MDVRMIFERPSSFRLRYTNANLWDRKDTTGGSRERLFPVGHLFDVMLAGKGAWLKNQMK